MKPYRKRCTVKVLNRPCGRSVVEPLKCGNCEHLVTEYRTTKGGWKPKEG